MFNKSGITKTTGAAPKQILLDVQKQTSVGCIVSEAVGVTVDGRKIAKAGTPVVLDFMNLQTPVTKGDAENAFTAALLHDVDVTNGNANGTALVDGVVNYNRVDTDVQAVITTALTATGHTTNVVFIKA